jgi:peptidyl-prolyl cis-trans isomerase SurA
VLPALATNGNRIVRRDTGEPVLPRGVNRSGFEYSDDPGTASKGGKLGQTNRGDLVPEYETAAYSMKEGEISQPVVSSFGVHIIRVNSRAGEKINTNHILFKIDPTEADMAATKTRADSIAAAAKGGADFGELALKYSIDAKTAAKGGDLGWFNPSDLPEDFRQPLAKLNKNDISEAFRSQFGTHVVKITDRVFARKVSLDEDFDRIEQLALRLKQEKEVDKWEKELAKEVYIERK